MLLRRKRREESPKLTPSQTALVLLRVLIIHVFVIACIYYALNAYWQWAINRDLRRIRLRGEPVTAQDLAGPVVPDNVNGAILLEKPSHRLDVSPGRSESNILSEYADATVPTPQQRDQAREVLARHRWRIAIAEQGLRRPTFQFSSDWSLGWDAKHLHHERLRRLATILRAQARLDLEEERLSDACRLLADQLQLSESLRSEPSLISQLTRLRRLRYSCRGIRGLLDCPGLEMASVRALRERLRAIDLSNSLSLGLAGDRAAGLTTLQRLRREWPRAESRYFPEDIPGAAHILFAAFWNYNILQMLKEYGAQLQLCDKPYRLLPPSVRQKGDDIQFGVLFFAGALLWPVGGAVASRHGAEAERTQAILALDLELYRRQHGGFPKALEDLRVIDPNIRLEDPFSGKPMRYSRTPEGYRLWSIGQNLRDDGGKEGKSREDGDIVWAVKVHSGSAPE